MLRRLPRTEVSESATTTVRSMLAPEVAPLSRVLEVARSEATALRALRREFSEYLQAALPAQAAELGLPADSLQAWIESELARFSGTLGLRVRVHPSDAAHMETASEIAARVGLSGGFTLVADAQLTAGGCVIESERAVLDGRVETKVAVLIAMLCRLESP